MADEAKTPSAETSATLAADPTQTQPGPDSQNAPHHTEGTPAAQGTEAVSKAQRDFLALLNARMTTVEGLALLALDFPASKAAAAQSYSRKWQQDARRCFTVVARLKRRMPPLPIT